MALRRIVTQPADFELVAAVAKVASHSNDIYPLVGSDVSDLFRLAICKEDILNTVETKQSIAQTLSSHDITILAGEVGNHSRAVHQGIESTLVQRPRVDVRVNAKIASGTKEECLALFPPSTGIKKSLAGCLQTVLCGISL